MDKKIKIGLIGLGTVGSGVFKTLKNFDNVEVVKIAVKNINKPRNIEGLDNSILTDNPYDVVNDPEIEIVAELVGGAEKSESLTQLVFYITFVVVFHQICVVCKYYDVWRLYARLSYVHYLQTFAFWRRRRI